MTAPAEVSDTPPGCEPDGQWISLAPWGFSKYEVRSCGGYGLDEDQWPVRRADTGRPLKVTLGTNGYPRVKPTDDQGKQRTVEVHALIMLANVGPPPDGLQTRHINSDPLDYRWAAGSTDEEVKANGGNLRYGTGPEQRKDQVAAGTAVPPPATFPCAARCGAMVASEGRRCTPCMEEAGIHAAAMLKGGMPLARVTRKLGYTSEAYVHALARQYGGYKGTLAQARAGHRKPLLRRMLGRFRRGSN